MPDLTAIELATRWNVHPRTVHRRAKSREIPGAMCIGRRWRFPLAAIEAFEQRHAVRDPLSMTDRAAARRSRRPR